MPRGVPNLPEVVRAARSGSREKTLLAVRDELAKAIASSQTRPSDLPALAKQLDQVMKDLEVIGHAEESDAVDEVANRRAARRSKTASR